VLADGNGPVSAGPWPPVTGRHGNRVSTPARLGETDILYSRYRSASLSRLLIELFDLPEFRSVRLWHAGVNDSYEVDCAGAPFIFRVAPAGWRTEEQLNWEVDLLRYLSVQGFPVAAPRKARDGNYVVAIATPEGKRPAVLFDFAPGNLPDQSDESAAAFGAASARLHNLTDGFKSQHKRFSIDREHLLDIPLSQLRPFLRGNDILYIERLAERLGSDLAKRADSLDTGICHGDLHGGNLHRGPEGILTFFDFDCAGIGWRAYDIAVFRWATNFIRGEGGTDESWEAFIRGYRSQRDLPQSELDAVPLFVAARQLWLMGLHAYEAPRAGASWLSNTVIGHYVGLLRHWDATYLQP
jgi:Ser/Thr protein kinase RdoA (MazF antagonist)